MLYKNGGSDAALTDICHCCWENEHLYRPTPSHVPLKTMNYSRKFRFLHHDTHIINTEGQMAAKRRQENLKWEGVIGSLTFATIEVNFDWTWIDLAVVMQCPISFQCHLRCIVDKTKDLPSLEINTNKQVFWSLLTTFMHVGGELDLQTL